MRKSNKKFNERSKTLSGLVGLAIEDIKKVRKDKKYAFSMTAWHFPRYKECSVCVAGSVIAGTLKADPDDYVIPEDYCETVKNKLYILQLIRTGHLDSDSRCLDLAGYTVTDKQVKIINYYLTAGLRRAHGASWKALHKQLIKMGL